MEKQNYKILITSVVIVALFILCSKDKNPVSPTIHAPTESTIIRQHGFDPDTLLKGFEVAQELNYIYSILIMRHDTLIAEKYFDSPYSHEIFPDISHHICSVTKSFTSALVGIALEKGYLQSVDQTMMSFFPEYEYLVEDSRKYNITIEHLLTAKSGFDTDDFNPDVHHPLANAIGQPMILNPGEFGTTFHYSSSNCHILSGILTKATGMSTLEFADATLFGALDIIPGYWRQDVDSIYFGGYGLMLTPRDMLKFGQLYLNNGVWCGEQVVSREWIERSTPNHQPYSWDVFPLGVRDTGYGYLWWNGYYNNHWAFFANGYGGQNIIVFPDLELIVVTTANPDVEHSVCVDQISEIVEWVKQYVLGAFE